MRSELKTVTLTHVNSADHTYRISTETAVEQLVRSIETLGVLSPPILIRDASRYQIISGFRRISACQYLGCSIVEARLLDPNTSPLDCARLAIAENSFQRPLNLIELSRAFQMLSDLLDGDEGLVGEAAALGLPENPSVIKKIRHINRLSTSIQAGIVSGTISLSVALEMGRIEPQAGEFFITLFKQLKWGLNRQREIITLVQEIARRDDMTISQVIQRERLREIMNDEDMNRSQKAQKIKSVLRGCRFPALTKAQTDFENQVKGLDLAYGLNLIPPRNFEDSAYSFILNFRNEKELRTRFAALGSVIQHPLFYRILTE